MQDLEPFVKNEQRNIVTLNIRHSLYRALNTEAASIHMTLKLYIVALLGQRQPLPPKREYTPRELVDIQNATRGKSWTAAELQEQNLPLCWDPDWLRARYDEGMGYQEMAEHYGYNRYIYGARGRALGLVMPKNGRRKTSG